MQESSRPHPLDASDEDDHDTGSRWSREPSSPSVAYQPLLKPSLRIAAFATIVLALGSVLTTAFRYGSDGYNISAFIFRSSGTILVLALLAVLLSFRIGHSLSRPRRHPSRQAVLPLGYGGFVVYNLLGLGIAWVVLIGAGWVLGAGVAVIASPLILIGAGLLATMIVFHDGYLRAYAIGSLTTLTLQFVGFAGLSSLILFNVGKFGSAFGVFFDMFSILLGVTLTIVIVSGLVSSGYVVALTSYTRRQRELLQQQTTDQPDLTTKHASQRV